MRFEFGPVIAAVTQLYLRIDPRTENDFTSQCKDLGQECPRSFCFQAGQVLFPGDRDERMPTNNDLIAPDRLEAGVTIIR